jgi:putative nucleotidyltransferase with HDIG domain
MVDIETRVRIKIEEYNPDGELGKTASSFLDEISINYGNVKKHSMGTAILAEEVAERLKKDKKAAFFSGLLHDFGKKFLDKKLFDGHKITDEEYQKIKTHAILGFEALKDVHLFIALCAGLHHALYKNGYGLTIKDFPENLSLATIIKVLEIAKIVSICDFTHANTNRKDDIRDGSNKNSNNLYEMLIEKHPNSLAVIETAIAVNKELIFN